jgi:ubiquinol-cytochrome c reductase iron-sulfur subunit
VRTPAPINRRSFLTYATLGTAAVTLSAGVWGLTRGLSPSADVAQEKWATKISLNNLVAGELQTIRFNNYPIFALRLHDEQFLKAQSNVDGMLHDPHAQNANLLHDAKANLENRSIDSEGTIVILDGRCPRRGCVVLYDAGDFDGWFCPCGGSHFDILGRFRKGISPTNMRIPRFTVSDDAPVTLLEGPQPFKGKDLDRLIYGNSDKG